MFHVRKPISFCWQPNVPTDDKKCILHGCNCFKTVKTSVYLNYKYDDNDFHRVEESRSQNPQVGGEMKSQ